MAGQPKLKARPMPPYRPGDPPPSEAECAGVDNGPCRSFAPMEAPWEERCRKCGYRTARSLGGKLTAREIPRRPAYRSNEG